MEGRYSLRTRQGRAPLRPPASGDARHQREDAGAATARTGSRWPRQPHHLSGNAAKGGLFVDQTRCRAERGGGCALQVGRGVWRRRRAGRGEGGCGGLVAATSAWPWAGSLSSGVGATMPPATAPMCCPGRWSRDLGGCSPVHLCSSQGSRTNAAARRKTAAARSGKLFGSRPFAPQMRRCWTPVTGTGMRAVG